MKRSNVLVVIPSYGHFDFVRKTILSLHWAAADDASIPDYLIVDDASEEWEQIDWNLFPNPSCPKIHFEIRAGLTRSWNEGLIVARERGYTYAICANSDLVFAPGSIESLCGALDSGVALAGPLTNAPGFCRWQDVRSFLGKGEHQINDSPKNISQIALHLAALDIEPIQCPLNGFCLAAKTETWWSHSISRSVVFNPSLPLEHNEVELQNRWYRAGAKTAMIVQSYVFHYRSVSRPKGLSGWLGTGAYRPL
jgi:GT2 family glycosyltransferase